MSDIKSDAATPGQAATEPPALYARWWRIINPSAPDATVRESWAECISADREFWTELADAQESHAADGEVVHLSPRDATYVTPCCGQTPFDLTRSDRMTNDPSLVTCSGAEPKPAPDPREVEEIVRTAVQSFRRCRSTGPVTDCPGCEKHVQAILSAVSAHLTAPREPQPAPELGTAWRLLNEARAVLAVTAAEHDDLARALDGLKARHAAVLGKFTSNGSGYTARMSGVVLARQYAEANLPVRDDLSHLAGQ